MLPRLTGALVVAGLGLLLAGVVRDSLALVYLSILCTALAGLTLIVFVQTSRRRAARLAAEGDLVARTAPVGDSDGDPAEPGLPESPPGGQPPSPAEPRGSGGAITPPGGAALRAGRGPAGRRSSAGRLTPTGSPAGSCRGSYEAGRGAAPQRGEPQPDVDLVGQRDLVPAGGGPVIEGRGGLHPQVLGQHLLGDPAAVRLHGLDHGAVTGEIQPYAVGHVEVQFPPPLLDGPDQVPVMDRNAAITAMTLAEVVATDEVNPGHRLWLHIEGWSAELGLTAPDALTWIAEPPSHVASEKEAAVPEDPEAAGA